LGIEVMNLETLHPVQYNKENLLNPYFIVGTLDLLNQLYPSSTNRYLK